MTKPDTIDPEALIAHTDFLRQLARSLLADEDRAHDVAQDVLAAALANPPREQGSLRAWLAGVARHLASRVRREESRRTAREHAAARHEATASAAELAERLETLRRLVEAVQRLDEPYRTVILLRFFENLPPRHIARELNIPVATVMTRLRRAVERLRAELDEREREWRRALVPIAMAFELRSLMPTALVALKLAAVVVLTLAPLAWLISPRGIDTPPQTRSEHAIANTAEPTAPSPDLARAPVDAAPSVTSSAAATNDARITGTVTDATGVPLAGATVDVLVNKRSVQTDERGRYALALPIGRSARKNVVAWADGCARQLAEVDVVAGKEATIDFRLPREMVIAGRVLDESGKPVADAVLQTYITDCHVGYPVRSATDGSFALRHLDPAIPQFSIDVRAPGFVHPYVMVQHHGEAVQQDIVLSRGAQVEGLVIDADGKPVAGATLVLGHEEVDGSLVEGVSANDGRFLIEHAPDGNLTLCTRHPTLAADLRPMSITSAARRVTDLTISLAAGRSLTGTVADEQAQPVAGARITCEAARFSLGRDTVTDESGRFALEGLPVRPIQIAIAAAGLRPWSAVVASDTTRVEARLERDARGYVIGRVRDARSGAPITSMRVRFVEPRLEPGEQRASGVSARVAGLAITSGSGTFSLGPFATLPGSVCAVEVSADGYASMTRDRVLVAASADDPPVEFPLEHGTPVTGIVIEASTGAPLHGVSIRLVPEAIGFEFLVERYHRKWPMTITQEDGSFRFEHVPAGTYALAVEHADFSTQRDGPFAVLATEPPLPRRIALDPGATLAGTMSGTSPSKTLLSLRVARVRGVALPSEERWQEARPDTEGRFVFAHLPAGDYELVALAEAFDVHTLYLTLAENESREVTIGRFDGSGTLRVSVECDGDVPPGLHLEIRGFRDRKAIKGWSDRLPRRTLEVTERDVEVTAVSAGDLSLRLYAFDSTTRCEHEGWADFTMQDGEQRHVTIKLATHILPPR